MCIHMVSFVPLGAYQIRSCFVTLVVFNVELMVCLYVSVMSAWVLCTCTCMCGVCTCICGVCTCMCGVCTCICGVYTYMHGVCIPGVHNRMLSTPPNQHVDSKTTKDLVLYQSFTSTCNYSL